MTFIRSIVLALLLATSVAAAPADRPVLRPTPDWKGTPAEFNYPASWMAYFPTAKVGDFMEYQSGGTRRRDEVVTVSADAVLVCRMVENPRASGGVTELWFKYKLTPDAKERLAKGQTEPAPKKGGKPSAKAKTPPKEPQTEVLKIAGTELKCRVVKVDKITTWHATGLPFDSIVKKESANDSWVVISFGRGK